MLAFRVYSAMSGDAFTVRMDPENFWIQLFKGSLATFSGIAANDQILLIGPPYKVLDAHFGPDMCSNGQRIYMFDKRIIAEVNAEPVPVKLKPFAVAEPAPPGVPISKSLASESSPLLRAVPDYETQFLCHIRRGEVLLSAVEQSAASCKRCFEQIENQRFCLEAAVSNLNDHFSSTKTLFESKQNKIISQQQAHKALLESFDTTFQQLGDITLHPSLQSLLSNSLAGGDEPTNSKSQHIVTLRDTIPIEKEIAWREKCRQSHQKVEENMSQLQAIFDKIAASMNKIVVPKDSSHSTQQLLEFTSSLDANTSTQLHHMEEMRQSYSSAVDEISTLLHYEESEREEKINELFTRLEATRKRHEQIIQPMEECCTDSLKIKDIFAETKTDLTRNIYSTLRSIAAVQTDIQFKLKKGMELMTRWRQGHNGYFQHLEKIKALPEAYATFLNEMIRRKKYTEKFEVLVKNSVNSASECRAKEIHEREHFMANMGSCLPPIFFDIVPSLVEKPPFFNATITDRQPIPDICVEDVKDYLEEFGIIATTSAVEDAVHIKGSENDVIESDCNSTVGQKIDDNKSLRVEKIEDSDAEIDVLQKKVRQLEEENKRLKCLAEINLDKQVQSKTENVACEESVSTSQEKSTISGSQSSSLRKLLDAQLLSLIAEVLKLQQHVAKHSESKEGHEKETQVEECTLTDIVKDLRSLITSGQNLSASIERSSSSQIKKVPKISFLELNVGDIALFLPTNKKDTFLAFTHELPYYYLSQDSLANFKSEDGEPPNYILGQIIFDEEKVASKDVASNIGSAEAPKILPDGTKYHLLEIVAADFSSF